MGVSREAIVGVSIGILNRNGIEGLTMRAIAKELNIKAASLYNHIGGKMELYGEIAERLCAQIALPDTLCGAEDCLREVFTGFRQALLSARDSTVIFENSIPNTPRRIAIIRVVGEQFLKMGVRPENLMTASNMVNNYVLSFCADELRFKNLPSGALENFTKTLSPNDRMIFTSEKNFDEQFLYGLQILFTGIKLTDANAGA